MDYNSLSKEVSYALRHAPETYNLTLDDKGWVFLPDLVSSLNQNKKWEFITEEDISKMISESSKKRHEISQGRIRAIYGHSTNKKIIKEVVTPPDVLYHGTAHKYLDSIMREGLIPKERQYVHLSEDVLTAVDVGKRRDSIPAILRVDAKAATLAGIKFYYGNQITWLSDTIPSRFLKIMDYN